MEEYQDQMPMIAFADLKVSHRQTPYINTQ